MTRGLSPCTCGSTAPGVAMRPSPGDDDRPAADHDVHPVGRVRVARAPEGDDAALADPDRGHAHAQDGVEHQHVGDDHVAGLGRAHGPEADPVAPGLGEAEQELVTGEAVVGHHLEGQAGVAEPDPVAQARAVHGHVVPRAAAHGWTPSCARSVRSARPADEGGHGVRRSPRSRSGRLASPGRTVRGRRSRRTRRPAPSPGPDPGPRGHPAGRRRAQRSRPRPARRRSAPAPPRPALPGAKATVDPAGTSRRRP